MQMNEDIEEEIVDLRRQIDSKNMQFAQMRGTIQATNRPSAQKISIFSDQYNNSFLRERGVPTQGPEAKRNSVLKTNKNYCSLV